jgi:hypothetical protein
LRWQRRKSGFPVTGCQIQNKLEPLTIILIFFFWIAVVNDWYSPPPSIIFNGIRKFHKCFPNL